MPLGAAFRADTLAYEQDMGVVSPIFSHVVGAAHTHVGLGGLGQAVCSAACLYLCSSWARRGGSQSGGEWVSPFNSITKQIQDPASWASSILIGISTRTPAPAEHFYTTENKFSNEPEWLNQETVGRDLYIEHTGVPNQIKQPKHVTYIQKVPFGDAQPTVYGFALRSLVSEPWSDSYDRSGGF